MDNLENTPVAGVEGAGATDVAATASGTALGAVPAPNQTDEAVKKQVEAVTKKAEDDIRRLKSTFDKRDADRQKELAQREEAFNQKIKELEVRGMDEGARKKYEEDHRLDELQKAAREKDTYAQKLAELQQARDYEKFFLARGINPSDLITDSTVEELARSGWEALDRKMLSMEAELTKLKSGKGTKDKDLPDAPDTLSHNAAPPTKSGLTDAIKKYANGDEDRFYKLLESGQLPESVLGLPKE